MPSSSCYPACAKRAVLPDSPDCPARTSELAPTITSSTAAASTAASECGLADAYREHRGTLLGFLRRKAGAEEATDLVQEVFARAAGSKQRGTLINPGGFLKRIAQNHLIDRARQQRSNDVLVVPFQEQRDASCAPQQEWQLEADDLLRLYEQAVDAMPFKTRRVFLMHRVDELSYREIHERLGISIATVEYHIMRALAHIATALEANQ